MRVTLGRRVFTLARDPNGSYDRVVNSDRARRLLAEERRRIESALASLQPADVASSQAGTSRPTKRQSSMRTSSIRA
jgi:hypothetical protein